MTVKRILIAALAGKGIAHPSKVQCGQELAVGQIAAPSFNRIARARESFARR